MIDMESRTACFTGHRELPTDDLPEISKRLEDTLLTLIEQGYCYFGAGGALGFDTLAAQAVLRLRERYPQIRLILVLPCLDQTRGLVAPGSGKQIARPTSGSTRAWKIKRLRSAMRMRSTSTV